MNKVAEVHCIFLDLFWENVSIVILSLHNQLKTLIYEFKELELLLNSLSYSSLDKWRYETVAGTSGHYIEMILTYLCIKKSLLIYYSFENYKEKNDSKSKVGVHQWKTNLKLFQLCGIVS